MERRLMHNSNIAQPRFEQTMFTSNYNSLSISSMSRRCLCMMIFCSSVKKIPTSSLGMSKYDPKYLVSVSAKTHFSLFVNLRATSKLATRSIEKRLIYLRRLRNVYSFFLKPSGTGAKRCGGIENHATTGKRKCIFDLGINCPFNKKVGRKKKYE